MVIKKMFLVDLENINRRFILGLENLQSTDRVILFYSEQAQLSMDILVALTETKAMVERHQTRQHTKNAMDFQICSYLGMLVNDFRTEYDYYIVSLDKGYLAALDLIKEMLPEIHAELVKNCNCEKKEEEVRATIDNLLSAFSRRVRKEAENAVRRSNNTSELHNYLQASLKEDSVKVYQTIKPYYYQLKTA